MKEKLTKFSRFGVGRILLLLVLVVCAVLVNTQASLAERWVSISKTAYDNGTGVNCDGIRNVAGVPNPLCYIEECKTKKEKCYKSDQIYNSRTDRMDTEYFKDEGCIAEAERVRKECTGETKTDGEENKDSDSTEESSTEEGGPVDDGIPETAIISTKGINNDEIECNGVIVLLKWVIRIMTGLIGALAVFGIVYAGFLYATSGDSPEKVKLAKERIMQVAIGIVLFLSMFALLNYLVPGGVFGSSESCEPSETTTRTGPSGSEFDGSGGEF